MKKYYFLVFIVVPIVFSGCRFLEEPSISIQQVIRFDDAIFTTYDSFGTAVRGDMAIFGIATVKGRIFPITIFGKSDDSFDDLIELIGKRLSLSDLKSIFLKACEE